MKIRLVKSVESSGETFDRWRNQLQSTPVDLAGRPINQVTAGVQPCYPVAVVRLNLAPRSVWPGHFSSPPAGPALRGCLSNLGGHAGLRSLSSSNMPVMQGSLGWLRSTARTFAWLQAAKGLCARLINFRSPLFRNGLAQAKRTIRDRTFQGKHTNSTQDQFHRFT